MNQLPRNITSLEVSEMVGRDHNEVLKDLRRISTQLGEGILPQSYFIESTYTNKQNKQQPCFLLTKKGCELYGTRMTGEKGTQFAVKYIDRFNEMEDEIHKPKSQLEIMQMQIEQMVKQEKEIQELKETASRLEEQHDNIVSILSLNNNDWRNKVNQIINAIAMKLGGFEYFKDVRSESYQMLEERAACLLDRRLDNRKSKMALRGSSKTAINKINKLDIIAEDKKLISVYVTVIKEMAVKYQLDLKKYELKAPVIEEVK